MILAALLIASTATPWPPIATVPQTRELREMHRRNVQVRQTPEEAAWERAQREGRR